MPAWTARPGGDNGNAFLQNDLGHVVGTGVHQHQIDPEGLVGQAFADADLLPQQLCPGHSPGGDHPQGSGVGTGGGKFTGGDVGHAALDNGELCPQDFIQLFQ